MLLPSLVDALNFCETALSNFLAPDALLLCTILCSSAALVCFIAVEPNNGLHDE